MSNPRQYTVTTGFDDNYVFPFLVMAFSASKNSNAQINFKIAFGENLLSQKNRDFISAVLNILSISFQFTPIDLSPNLKSQDHIQITAFARLYLADNLSENFLWLDCDLICRTGWDEIFERYDSSLELSSVCAAVDAASIQNKLTQKKYLSNAAMRRMGNNYFNSGVLLVNPRLWSLINKNESWEDLYLNYNDLGFQFADQCVLNYLCHKSFSHLDKSFNVYATIRKKYVAMKDIKILHFPGGDKPWSYKKFDLSILASPIKPIFIYNYLKVISNLIDSVAILDSGLSNSLKEMQSLSHRKRSLSRLLIMKVIKSMSL
jgi:lipopolysaccharide biosynthesis glycosyltransferase